MSRPAVAPALASPRRGALRWARRGLAVALLLGGWILVLTGSVHVCEQQLADSGRVATVCHGPHVDDPRLLGLVVLALALLVPDIAEFSVPGLGSLRLRVGDAERRTGELGEQVRVLDARLSAAATAVSRTTVVVSPPTTAAESAVQLGPHPAPLPAVRPVVEARLQLGEAALRALLEPRDGPLAGARLHLYVPDEDQLLPVSDPRLGDEDGWTFGEAVVGSAWEARATVYSRGPQVQQDVEHLPVERRGRYRGIAVVTATAVLNAAGRPIGVVSASSTNPAFPLDGDDALVELEATAGRVARVVIDLWGWDDDTADTDTDTDTDTTMFRRGGRAQ